MGSFVGITGFELITNNIRKKFYYQPNLNFEEAELLLRAELEKYKSKQVNFGQHISFNAVIAGFPIENPKVPKALSFHVANQNISERYYEKLAILSLIPDDISFNPNQIITDNLNKSLNITPTFQVQTLQRNALYKLLTNPKRSIRLFFKK